MRLRSEIYLYGEMRQYDEMYVYGRVSPVGHYRSSAMFGTCVGFPQ